MSPSAKPFDEAKYKALMDGLACKEVSLAEISKNKDRRIDSAFYTARILRNPDLKYVPIGQYLTSTQYGVSKDMNEEHVGYPIYRMNEIHSMLCDLNPAKSVELSRTEFEKLKLNDGDVLFNRTNSYELVGRTGIYYYNGVDQTYASYLVRLNPDNESILSEYLAAFLNSKYGVADIKRRARQSINQTNVNPQEVKEIRIPLISKPFQKLIKECFISANKLRKSAAVEYASAESIMMQAFDSCEERAKELQSGHLGNAARDTYPVACREGVDLPSHTGEVPTVSIKSLAESFSLTGRLDAEYYQDKFERYRNALHTIQTVSSICKIYDKSFVPKTDGLYHYIELANVGMTGDVSVAEKQEGGELPSRARRIVKAGQVIVSSVEGSLQSCALITDELDGSICSTGFYVVESDSINSETLLVLFKSPPIQALMKQRCSGTILTAITKDEFMSMPFPEIETSIQERIASKVQESFALRRKAEKMMEYAKHAVEIAIEQNENVALDWLKRKALENCAMPPI